MKPCDDCGSHETAYREKYKTILCDYCTRLRDDPSVNKYSSAVIVIALLGGLVAIIYELITTGKFPG